MRNGHIPTAFAMLIEEFESAIHETNKLGAQAFSDKKYHEIPLLTEQAKTLEAFQAEIVSLEDKWSSLEEPESEKERNGNWTKQNQATPVAFHAACLQLASTHLRREFVKQTRSSFISKDGDIALVCSVSREYDNGTQRYCWFSFTPDHAEFLAAKPAGYLLLGCGAPDRVLLIPFADFLPWSKNLNRTERGDGSYYSHIRIVTDSGRFLLMLKGKDNQVDISKYRIREK